MYVTLLNGRIHRSGPDLQLDKRYFNREEFKKFYLLKFECMNQYVHNDLCRFTLTRLTSLPIHNTDNN